MYREVALALSYVTALVLTIVLAANRIPGEIEHRTAYPVITRPVARWEYLAGTWLGITAVVGGSIAAFTVVEQAWGLVKYASPMWILWEGALGIWLEMSVIAALCVAVSSVTGPTVSAVASLTFVFVGHTRDSVRRREAPAPGALAVSVPGHVQCREPGRARLGRVVRLHGFHDASLSRS